jgi:hypothetical protein
MAFQFDFLGGSTPENTRFLKCPKCMDALNFQRKLIIIPPDPPPIYNTRPEPYDLDETDWLSTTELLPANEQIITTQDSIPIITQTPDPASVAETSQISASLVLHLGSLSTVYLDLFLGNPASGGVSVLSNITGSATRGSLTLTTVSGIASNFADFVVTSNAKHVSLAQQSVSFVALYDAPTSGNLLVSGQCSVSPTIGKGFAVVVPALGLSVNLN